MELKTKRLRIVSLNIEQMAQLCEGQNKLNDSLGLVPGNVAQDEHLQDAFREMHQQCCEHLKDYLWHTNWQIVLNEENKSIGSIGFRGPSNDRHEVEVGYGIDKNYQNQGYATEALKAICDWAFSQNVYYVQVQTEQDNEPSKKVLGKCGFKQVGSGDEGLLFELEKPASAWMPIYMCLGMSVGLSIGLSLNKMAVGICTGLVMGIALGTALDSDDKKKRKRD
ncbi:MAG: GNAT family N-acetyltransferase [Clostridia bacterium]|jgi:RimJ/RimL family protein N-acetyltransferase